MATTTDLALIDTNVLVHSFYDEQPQYPAAVRLRDSAQEDDAALCIAPKPLRSYTLSSPAHGGSARRLRQRRRSQKSTSSWPCPV